MRALLLICIGGGMLAVILALVVVVIILAPRTGRRPETQSETFEQVTVEPEGGEEIETD